VIVNAQHVAEFVRQHLNEMYARTEAYLAGLNDETAALRIQIYFGPRRRP